MINHLFKIVKRFFVQNIPKIERYILCRIANGLTIAFFGDMMYNEDNYALEDTMSLRTLKNRYIGDRAFYRLLAKICLPIIIQNSITNFVSMLDNIMVGRTGTDPMTGVSIANQLIFVFNILIFGAVAGPGIFTSQYHGSRDSEGVRYTMRFKMAICTAIGVLGMVVFWLWRSDLVWLYISEDANVGDPAATLAYGADYLRVIVLGLIPFAVTQAYSSTLRETGETVVPMRAGIVAVLVNLFFNWVLIFGHLGAPAMGVIGAAVATVISRYVEMLIVVIWTHRRNDKNPFAKGLYRSLYIPKKVIAGIIVKGSPLMLNEALWSVGTAAVVQLYSTRGLDVVSATNISNVVSNLFSAVFISMGSSVSIIVGNALGAGKTEEAVDLDRKMLFTSVTSSALLAVMLIAVSPFFPLLYNTEPQIQALATRLMWAVAAGMPINAYLNACYFTLRSGGRTFITFVFDSGAIWAVNYTVVFLLTRFAPGMSVPMILLCEQLSGLIRCAVGFILVKKRIWVNNLVS